MAGSSGSPPQPLGPKPPARCRRAQVPSDAVVSPYEVVVAGVAELRPDKSVVTGTGNCLRRLRPPSPWMRRDRRQHDASPLQGQRQIVTSLDPKLRQDRLGQDDAG